MNVFMHKSECARKRIKGGLEIKDYKILNGLEMPEEARQILEAYRRKTL